MLHVLTITYEAKCLFTGRVYSRTEALRLNWEGVLRALAEPFYREHGARFALSPYWGQPTDN